MSVWRCMLYELYGCCMLYGLYVLYVLHGVQMRETKRAGCMGAHTAQKLYAALYGHVQLRPEAGVKKTVNTVSRPLGRS